MKNEFEGVILAGGKGTRIQDLTKQYINKPLIEIVNPHNIPCCNEVFKK